jgi:signal transduction histidine kinase
MRTTATTLGGKRLYIVALHDVTRQKEAEQDLDLTMAVAAHELASPLAEIKLLVHLLRDDQALATERRQRAQIIDRIGDRITHAEALVSKLRTASKIEAHTAQTTPEPVPVLEAVLERLSELADRTQQVYVWCDPELVALVDRIAFVEMLTNYLENAFAYGEPPIEVRVTRHAGTIDVRVCDHGPGVRESFVPHLFERFRRDPHVEKTTDGSGLGLWIVRSLAEGNGGNAWYEHNSDEGSCFCLRLPAEHGGPSARPL